MTEESRRDTRALRKYEAAALDDASGDPRSMRFLSPFGPLIGVSLAPASLLQRVNTFADQHIDGGHGSEFIVPLAVARSGEDDSLITFVQSAIRHFVIASERAEPTRILIDRIWIVSQYAATPSPMHFHSGDLSGVLYLKAPPPPDSEELEKNYMSGRQAGFINFISGGKQPFAKSLISFPPEVGSFYVFPGWLLHGAEPFRGPGERRSLSFNARVTLD